MITLLKSETSELGSISVNLFMKFKIIKEGNIRFCGSVRLAVIVVQASFYQ